MVRAEWYEPPPINDTDVLAHITLAYREQPENPLEIRPTDSSTNGTLHRMMVDENRSIRQ